MNQAFSNPKLSGFSEIKIVHPIICLVYYSCHIYANEFVHVLIRRKKNFEIYFLTLCMVEHSIRVAFVTGKAVLVRKLTPVKNNCISSPWDHNIGCKLSA